MFKNGVKSGVLDISEFNSEGQLFGLAQVCLRAGICVVCQMLTLGLDLTLLVKMLIEIVEPVLDGTDVEPTARRRDAMQVLHSFAEDEHFNDSDAPIFKAIASVDPEKIAAIGAFMTAIGAGEVGRRWERAAEQSIA
ncbi:hypothetical protein D7044_16675 [Micromonospora musae]|uniref:Uncharacterized protein n=2 Tax=Micromonospora musae TaxID=1894970 RepID=A0A3A9Y0U8_9ACTN|nr:hypothetical protein D7044_16675 [Micromonospora musae]